MVTDTMPDTTEQVDQVQETPDAPTEGGPQLELDAAAAEQAVEEAAAEAVTTAPAEQPDKIAELEARMAELQKQLQQSEKERRKRQSENAIRAAEEAKRAAERAELEDAVAVALGSAGVYEPNQELVGKIISRVAGKDAEITRRATLSDVAEAFTAAAAETLGGQYDGDLTPAAEAYLRDFTPFVKDMYERARTSVLSSGDFIPKADLPKLVDAEIQRRNAVARQGKEPLKRVEGTATPNIDRSLEAVTQRIISNTFDDQDSEIWNSRFNKR